MQLIEFANRILEMSTRGRKDEHAVYIQVFTPGSIGGTPCVEVETVWEGFDWDARKIVLTPKQPVTLLTREEVDAIKQSAKQGQSWHAYQQYKKQQAEIDRLKGLLAAAELGKGVQP